MKSAFIVALILGLSGQHAAADQSSQRSVMFKVVKLLQDMKKKLNEDTKAEAKEFNEKMELCRTSSRDQKLDIASEKDDIEDEQATISKSSSQIATASAEIEGEASTLTGVEGQVKAAEKVRAQEKADFKAAETELRDSIDTLERALNVLQRKMRGGSLLQTPVDRNAIKNLLNTLDELVTASSLSLHDQRKLTALVQSSQENEDEDELSSQLDKPKTGPAGPRGPPGPPGPPGGMSPAQAAKAQDAADAEQAAEDEEYAAKAEAAKAVEAAEAAKAKVVLAKAKEEAVEAGEGAEEGPPGPSGSSGGYKTQGGSILDMIENLKQKAESQLRTLRKEEANAQHNHEMLKASLLQQIKVSKADMARSKEAKADASQIQAGAQGEFSRDQPELVNDQTELKDRTIDCKKAKAEYEVSYKASGEEAAAIDAALEGLKKVGDDGSASSFIQLKTSSPDQFEVVNVLRRLASREQSSALTQLAGRVSTAVTLGTSRGIDPFQKVRQMIAAMVSKLEKEAGAEAKHKEYCDKETKETAAKKEELGQGVQKFTSRGDKAKAQAAMAKEAVVTLQDELSRMASELAEASKLRQEQAATYKASKADLTEGLQGLRTALTVLRKQFGEGAEFIQRSSSDHTSTGNAAIQMLELVESDMSKKLAAVEFEESDAKSEYEKLTKETRMNKAVKEEAVKYKIKETTRLQKAITEYASDLDGAQAEMDAVLQYADNIKSMCDGKAEETYEEKVARRQEEVEGLKDALKVLQGQQAAAFLQTSSLRGSAVTKHTTK